jgi:hypothetical protein
VTYLLDTMIVSYFLNVQREKELAAATRQCPMSIVDEVRQELVQDKQWGGKAFERWLSTSGIEVRSITVGSDAFITLSKLLNPAAPKGNRGERASIALAASDPSLVLACHDKAAMWIALRELWMPGERILGVSVFLRRLREQHAIEDPAVLDEVIASASPPSHWPTWWSSWRAAMPQPGDVQAEAASPP